MAAATPRVLDWYFDYVSPFSYLQLEANGEEAVGRGVFGVPTFWVDGELFWTKGGAWARFLCGPEGITTITRPNVSHPKRHREERTT